MREMSVVYVLYSSIGRSSKIFENYWSENTNLEFNNMLLVKYYTYLTQWRLVRKDKLEALHEYRKMGLLCHARHAVTVFMFFYNGCSFILRLYITADDSSRF